MILGFHGKETEAVWRGDAPKGFSSSLVRSAQRKLAMLEAAVTLDSLRCPPGNHLEALKGDRLGQHSIRINDQWRVCFVWHDGAADRVEITDYH